MPNWIRAVCVIAGMYVIFGGCVHAGPLTDIGRCIEDLAIPRFGPVAQSGGEGGTIALITLDDQGRMSKVSFKGGSEHHHAEVKGYMEMSTFSKKCAGVTLEIAFSFRIVKVSGSRDCTFAWVNFRGPNHFVITLLPGTTPIID